MSETLVIGPDEYATGRIKIRPGMKGALIIFEYEDEAPTPAPVPAADIVHGDKAIDVSKHNCSAPKPPIDWPMVRAVAKVEKAMIRASYGDTQDEKWTVNWPESKKAEMKRGPYHYWQNETDKVKQADTFLRALNAYQDAGEIKWALDAEDRSPAITPYEFEEMRYWLERVERETGVHGRFYTGLSVYDWAKLPEDIRAWLAEYELWKAQYTTGACLPLVPWGWPRLWQFTFHGCLPGIEGNVDLNIGCDGQSQPEREWWWRGCFSDVKNAAGEFPANYFVRAANSPLSFCDAPHGKVVETRPVSYPMTVRRITADGWLCVHNDGKNDWWVEKSQVRLV